METKTAKMIAISAFFISLILLFFMILTNIKLITDNETGSIWISIILALTGGISFIFFIIKRAKEGRKYLVWFISNIVLAISFFATSSPLWFQDFGGLGIIFIVLPYFGILCLISLIIVFFLKEK